ncbi:hypothetical protein BH24ACT10_BH24ACT10_06790 [soil metagenome]
MRHEPERDAARLLGGVLSAQEREAFTRHLLDCSGCWAEFDQARRGRALAEGLRTAAPVHLRDHVRGLVEAETSAAGAAAGGSGRGHRWLVRLGVPVAAAVAVALVVSLCCPGYQPPSLRHAVADYTAQELPGAQLPEERAPDLSALDLQPVGAGGGSYAGLEVDGYAYRDPAGRRVVLYLSDQPFPEAPGARMLAGEDGPWVVERGDVVVLCARLPHALLVVGQDDQLVRSTASALGVL